MVTIEGLDITLFKQFAMYCTILILKMMSLSLLTMRIRFKRKVFANPEDCHGPLSPRQHINPILNDAFVERIRRCHLNDIENILPFVIIGLMYIASGPDPEWAVLHFRIFTCCRLLHTLAYVCQIRQPLRFLSFLFGFSVTLSMAISVIREGIL